ncbi:hypothetical protein FHX42_003514 [Saccharopolyspora lacisalsi]|uniref:Uncharacterized protein n=1 Tax=Halosaccharopolyspora lacisalsi TaxID=1000566 RepID=A0A839E5G6_9PSEU|nr:hypothetical protein [Halosaccharopolyspora lacisalsi]MBA8826138.1 hypothetical protein [Halosaccharopolyspora lacisalsi]
MPGEASPDEGTLTGPDAAVLELLEQHTATAGRCWFGVWDGYGWEAVSRALGPRAPR